MTNNAARTNNAMDEPFVYDKAKYHYQGEYPAELAEDQAFVHTGMYLGWIIDHDLYSDFFVEETEELIAQFKRREITATDIYKNWDGCLVDDMLSPKGNAFSRAYFDFNTGAYLRDYETHLADGLPTLYHVQETNENYAILTSFVDKRYEEWKRTGKIGTAGDEQKQVSRRGVRDWAKFLLRRRGP